MRWCWDTSTSPSAMQTVAAWECARYNQQQFCAPAEPLYKERSEVVLGQKDVPISYADRAEEGEGAEEAAEKKDTSAAAEEEGEIPAGVPEFWLGAMRAHPLISEHVRLAIPFSACCHLLCSLRACGEYGQHGRSAPSRLQHSGLVLCLD